MDYKKLIKGGAIVAGAVGLTLGAVACTKQPSYTSEDLAKAVSEARAQGANEVDITLDNQVAIDDALADYESNLLNVSTEAAVIETPVTREICSAYTFDDRQLGDNLAVTFEEPDYCLLKEGEVEFNEEDYDFRTEIVVSEKAKIAYSGGSFDSDFADEPRMVLEGRKAISYIYSFEEGIDFSEISADNELTIDFFGAPLTIVKAESNSITVLEGTKARVKLDQEVNGVKVLGIADNEVMVQYGDEVESINEGKAKKFLDGTRVRVDSVFDSNNDENDMAILVVGKNAGKTIKDGDDYKTSEDFAWDIDLTEGKLSVVYDTSLTQEDEALALGEYIDFPDDFARLTFVQLNHPDTEDYSLEFDESIDVGDVSTKVVMVSGKLEYGSTGRDATEIAWDGETFYVEEDGEWTEVFTPTLKVNNMKIIQGWDMDTPFLRIGDLVAYANIPGGKIYSIEYAGNDISGKDQDVLAKEGFIIVSPEDSIDDSTLELKGVPEEEPEYGLEVKGISL